MGNSNEIGKVALSEVNTGENPGFTAGAATGGVSAPVDAMTVQRNARLSQLETVVENWWEATLAAAKALVEIKEAELYKATHQTFEQYVAERWQKTKQWAYDLCNWYEVNVLAGADDNPLSMAATRPLKAMRKHPDKVRKVVAQARRVAKKAKRSSPTAKDIEAAKQDIFPAKPKSQPTFFYEVVITGSDVNLIRAAVDDTIGTVTAEDDDSLDLEVVNLNALFRVVAEVAAEKGTLKVSFGIDKRSVTAAAPVSVPAPASGPAAASVLAAATA